MLKVETCLPWREVMRDTAPRQGVCVYGDWGMGMCAVSMVIGGWVCVRGKVPFKAEQSSLKVVGNCGSFSAAVCKWNANEPVFPPVPVAQTNSVPQDP